MRNQSRAAPFLLTMLTITACAPLHVGLPSCNDSPTGARLPSQAAWRGLLANSPAVSQRYSKKLFGGDVESVGLASTLEGL